MIRSLCNLNYACMNEGLYKVTIEVQRTYAKLVYLVRPPCYFGGFLVFI